MAQALRMGDESPEPGRVQLAHVRPVPAARPTGQFQQTGGEIRQPGLKLEADQSSHGSARERQGRHGRLLGDDLQQGAPTEFPAEGPCRFIAYTGATVPHTRLNEDKRVRSGIWQHHGHWLPETRTECARWSDWPQLFGSQTRVELGDEVEAVVLEVDKANQRIAVGVKQLSQDPWENIDHYYKVGDLVTGKVTKLASFGAFVGLQHEIDGLVHISDLSWTQRVKHPSDMFQKNDEVEAVVLDIDQVNKRISLGMKQLTPDPWHTVAQKYPVGSRVQGKVISLMDYGAFVELESGIEGLIHISEMSWTRKVAHPSKILQVGQQVEVAVLNVDPGHRRISLGLKQIMKNNQQNRQNITRENLACEAAAGRGSEGLR